MMKIFQQITYFNFEAMDTSEHFIRTNNQQIFIQKHTNTPHTATSISDNPFKNQKDEMSFSSIIPSVEKLFLPKQANDEYFEQQASNEDQKQKKPQVSSEQLILSCGQDENIKLKYEIVLWNSGEVNKQQMGINLISLEVVQIQQLQEFQIMLRDQIQGLDLDRASLVCIAKFSTLQLQRKSSLKWSVSVRFTESGFNRQLCTFSPNQLSQNPYLYPQSQTLIIKQSNPNPSLLTIILPYQKILDLKTIQTQLLTKSHLLNTVKSIHQLKGILFYLCHQNMGSRIVQKLIHLKPKLSIQVLCKELKGKFHELMMDKYGNYVVQKVFFHLQSGERQKFIENVMEFVPEVSKTKFGTFCLQYILIQSQNDIICISLLQTSITNHLPALSCNQFSTHLIQKLLLLSPTPVIQTYFTTPQTLFQIATTKHGILTIKSLMSRICRCHIMNSTKRIEFLNLVYNNFQPLITDEYGHFLIQELLKYYPYNELNWVFYAFTQKIVLYATNTHSLSVLRQYLETFTQTWISPLVGHIFVCQQTLQQLMDTKTGSFLIHLMLDMIDPWTRSWMITRLSEVQQQLSCPDRIMKWKKFLKK